jgi:hypothetical protein
MADQHRLAIVILDAEERGYLVVLMHLDEQGNIDWQNKSEFVLTSKPAHDDAQNYAIGLSNILPLKLLEIRYNSDWEQQR